MVQEEKFIPALNHQWLTPLYDPLSKWVMREDKFKRDLVARAAIRSGMRVLDLGCGTGTLAILVKQLHPDAQVVGLDADEKILEIARAKAAKANAEVTFDQGMAFQLPYPDRSFDRVLSSLVLHHLTREDKQRAFKEAHRVLRPGGEICILDFGKPHGMIARGIGRMTRRLERAADNIDGLLPQFIRDAGFDRVVESANYASLFGTLSLYNGVRRESE